ncbi:hypothetical protein VTJ49DRAFT_6267 [Mycothermus thermophilus]|uniref:C2H2-type domain-containing protein n=1 Tax=Humicola insolens TaxID=85995 RepID=A0ABR3V227_HUMIN
MTATTATAAPNLGQPSVDDSVYDPDEAFPRNTPPLQPLRPTLQPSPSPPPTISSSSSPSPRPGNKDAARRRRPKPSQGDVLLISYLDGHRHEPAAYFGPSDPEDEDPEDPDLREDSASLDGHWEAGQESRDAPAQQNMSGPDAGNMTATSLDGGGIGATDLKSLAAGALAAAAERIPHAPQPDAGPTSPVPEHDVSAKPQLGPAPTMTTHVRRPEPLTGERNIPPPMPSPYSPRSFHSPRESGATPSSYRTDLKSPTSSIHSNSHSEGLPPISLSPRTNGQTLPSIRSQLGDIPPLGPSHARGSHPGFPTSPPPVMQRLPSLHSRLGSPPMPPSNDSYRDPLSPVHPLAAQAASPGFYYSQQNGLRRPPEFGSTSSETSSARPSSASPPASALDRMNLDGITIQATGNYVCTVPGCNAQPFQTQYLLNSHAKVHSSERPHYCPVPGCSRGEGGKGFKRKNEMIRHGLVHESPGYVCPFCPDRDHKYPRPDNLQRHVKAHHPDKDKDDPQLRDVLSQRPGGPNRGRRRRAGPS